MKTFKEADILLPGKEVNMEKWSVIACDQFTSEPEYWEEVKKFAGDSPYSRYDFAGSIFGAGKS